MPRSEAVAPVDKPSLVRAIGTGTLAANVVNLTVGAGIFALPALVAAQLGSATILGYAACSIILLLVFLCFAEAGSRVHGSGGAYAYTEAAFGPFAGFLTSSLLWFGYAVFSDAAIADIMISTIATAIPVLAQPIPRALALIGIFSALAVVNIIGVRSGARFAVGVTLVKLLPLLALIVAGLPSVSWGEVIPSQLPPGETLGSATLLLYFAFGGGECAVTPSGEIRNPTRTVPRGLLLGLGAVLALYMGVQIVSQGVLGADLATDTATPLAAVAERLFGHGGRVLLLAAAAFSIFGTLSGDLLASPRCIFGAAQDGLLPRYLAAIHPRFRTPYVSIAVFAALVCVSAIAGAFRALAILASASILLVELGVCLSVLALRRQNAGAPAIGFRVPGGPVIPLLGAASVIWLLSHLSRTEVLGVLLMLVISSVLYLRVWWGRRGAIPAIAGAAAD
jgi:amino acid transporter